MTAQSTNQDEYSKNQGILSVQKPLNVQEAAAFPGLRPSCVYNLCHFGKLPHFKPGGKKIVFKQSDLENYLYRNRKAAALMNTVYRIGPAGQRMSGVFSRESPMGFQHEKHRAGHDRRNRKIRTGHVL
ncbi:MAG: helix-turn-helix domain-containing protein [Treponema sp.]|jgi:excisionase family DNA binding protein|nr:helix-turn-helix domain-containing protein [Treponema sp.]